VNSNDYSIRSYSSEGEDILLKRIFEYRDIAQGGFYVDVGAHHPYRFSNTFFFYELGWSGINIDAMPDSMKLFSEVRTRDINLEVGISGTQEKLIYYMFNESALNGFDKDIALKRDGLANYFIVEHRHMRTAPLKEVLDVYLPHEQEIDFLSIDVEGLEHEVVTSNDWNTYRPKVILVEILYTDIDQIASNKTYLFLKKMGYTYFAKTFGTHVFIRNDFYEFRFHGLK